MKKIILITIVLAIILTAFAIVKTADANPSRILAPSACTTSGNLSTTSASYLAPGLATSTITCDIANVGSGAESFDSAILGIQFNASSTDSILAWKYEYSQDGIDWYPESYDNASSTAFTYTTEVTGPQEHRWTYTASSTVGSETAPRATSTKSIIVKTPTRYLRVVFYQPIGSARGAMWAQIIGKNELR